MFRGTLDDRQVDLEGRDDDAGRDAVGGDQRRRGRRRGECRAAGSSAGRPRRRRGVAVTIAAVGSGVGVGSTAPVYVSSPPAISDTPTAVRMAGRRRLRSAPTLLTGAACYQRTVCGASGTLVLVPSRLMGSRLSIVAGLLAGLLAAGALLAGFVFVGPDPVRATPTPAGSRGPASRRRVGFCGRRVAVAVGLRRAVRVARRRRARRPSPRTSMSARPRRRSSCRRSGGGEIDLAALRGKPVWSTSCGRTARRASTSSR